MDNLPGVDQDLVGKLIEIPKSDTTSKCKLCFHPAANENIDLGPLYEYAKDPLCEVYRAHYYCLLFRYVVLHILAPSSPFNVVIFDCSSGLDQNGGEDDEVKGFLTKDILKEWRRGQRLKVIKFIFSTRTSFVVLYVCVISVLLLRRKVCHRGVLEEKVRQELPLAVWLERRLQCAIPRRVCFSLPQPQSQAGRNLSRRRAGGLRNLLGRDLGQQPANLVTMLRPMVPQSLCSDVGSHDGLLSEMPPLQQ